MFHTLGSMFLEYLGSTRPLTYLRTLPHTTQQQHSQLDALSHPLTHPSYISSNTLTHPTNTLNYMPYPTHDRCHCVKLFQPLSYLPYPTTLSGLRHLCVINKYNQVLGMITRADLVSAHMMKVNEGLGERYVIVVVVVVVVVSHNNIALPMLSSAVVLYPSS